MKGGLFDDGAEAHYAFINNRCCVFVQPRDRSTFLQLLAVKSWLPTSHSTSPQTLSRARKLKRLRKAATCNSWPYLNQNIFVLSRFCESCVLFSFRRTSENSWCDIKKYVQLWLNMLILNCLFMYKAWVNNRVSRVGDKTETTFSCWIFEVQCVLGLCSIREKSHVHVFIQPVIKIIDLHIV